MRGTAVRRVYANAPFPCASARFARRPSRCSGPSARRWSPGRTRAPWRQQVAEAPHSRGVESLFFLTPDVVRRIAEREAALQGYGARLEGVLSMMRAFSLPAGAAQEGLSTS